MRERLAFSPAEPGSWLTASLSGEVLPLRAAVTQVSNFPPSGLWLRCTAAEGTMLRPWLLPFAQVSLKSQASLLNVMFVFQARKGGVSLT